SVRRSMEALRAKQEAYFNDLDPADMAACLAHGGWRQYDWGSFTYRSAPNRAQRFRDIASSDELRNLAGDGFRLFEAFFPPSSALRAAIDKLSPGARLDIDWPPRRGAGWIAQVPWGLMCVEPPIIGAPVDPTKFLGLRYRLSCTSFDTPPGLGASKSLGGAND